MEINSFSPVQSSFTVPSSSISRLGKLGFIAMALVAFSGQPVDARNTYGVAPATPKLDDYSFTYQCNLSVEANALAASAQAIFNTQSPTKALEVGKEVSKGGEGLEMIFFNGLATTLFTRETLIGKCQEFADSNPIKYSGSVKGYQTSPNPSHNSYGASRTTRNAPTKLVDYTFTYQCNQPVEFNAVAAAAEVLFNTQSPTQAAEIKKEVTTKGELLSGLFFNSISEALFSKETLIANCQKQADANPITYQGPETGSVKDIVMSWFN